MIAITALPRLTISLEDFLRGQVDPEPWTPRFEEFMETVVAPYEVLAAEQYPHEFVEIPGHPDYAIAILGNGTALLHFNDAIDFDVVGFVDNGLAIACVASDNQGIGLGRWLILVSEVVHGSLMADGASHRRFNKAGRKAWLGAWELGCRLGVIEDTGQKLLFMGP